MPALRNNGGGAVNRQSHSATFYIQLEPSYGWGIDPRTGEKRIVGAKAVGLTQQRPGKPKPGTIAVKLEVEVPEAFFLPLRPAAVIALPEDLGVLSTPVQVQAIDELGDLEVSS